MFSAQLKLFRILEFLSKILNFWTEGILPFLKDIIFLQIKQSGKRSPIYLSLYN
jgi:hypothetical protein